MLFLRKYNDSRTVFTKNFYKFSCLKTFVVWSDVIASSTYFENNAVLSKYDNTDYSSFPML